MSLLTWYWCHYDEQVCDGKMGENKKQNGLRGGTGDKRVVPALLPEAMVMSMVLAASEGLDWIHGMITAVCSVHGLCCPQRFCEGP